MEKKMGFLFRTLEDEFLSPEFEDHFFQKDYSEFQKEVVDRVSCK